MEWRSTSTCASLLRPSQTAGTASPNNPVVWILLRAVTSTCPRLLTDCPVCACRRLSSIAFGDMNPFPRRLLRNRRVQHLERLQKELKELEELQKEFVTERAEHKDKELDMGASEDDEEIWLLLPAPKGEKENQCLWWTNTKQPTRGYPFILSRPKLHLKDGVPHAELPDPGPHHHAYFLLLPAVLTRLTYGYRFCLTEHTWSRQSESGSGRADLWHENRAKEHKRNTTGSDVYFCHVGFILMMFLNIICHWQTLEPKHFCLLHLEKPPP